MIGSQKLLTVSLSHNREAKKYGGEGICQVQDLQIILQYQKQEQR